MGSDNFISSFFGGDDRPRQKNSELHSYTYTTIYKYLSENLFSEGGCQYVTENGIELSIRTIIENTIKKLR